MINFHFVTLKVQARDTYDGDVKKAILNALHNTVVNRLREDSGIVWVDVKEGD